MALMLLHERHKGQQSEVSGYVQQMPSSFDTLLHWSPEELQLLAYPHMIQQVGASWHCDMFVQSEATAGSLCFDIASECKLPSCNIFKVLLLA